MSTLHKTELLKHLHTYLDCMDNLRAKICKVGSTKELRALMQEAKTLLDNFTQTCRSVANHELVGRVVSFTVADGYTHYLVLETRKLYDEDGAVVADMVHLTLLPNLEDYCVPTLGAGGWVEAEQIRWLVQSQDAFADYK